jgi:hypothetical protein
MKPITGMCGAALLLAAVSLSCPAEERMIAGTETGQALIETGAGDTLSAPATVLRQMTHDARGLGPVGLATGAVRGGVRGGVQALKGAARMTIGILDTLTAPLKGE